MAKAKKLPSGNWRVQASITVDGQVLRKSFTGSDKKTVELEAKKWQVNQEEHSEVKSITLEQAYDRYIESKNVVLSPSTIREYKRLKKNSLQSIMKIKINCITQEAIQKAINKEAEIHSPKTVRNIHGLLSAVLQMFRPNLMLHTTLPEKKEVLLNIPDDDDIHKLFEFIKGTKIEVPVLLAAFGPMRRGEICALTSDDIHGNLIEVNKAMVHTPEGTWTIKPPKTFAGNRTIEFPDFVIEKLSCIKGKIYDGTPDSLTSAFTKALARAGIPHFRFHDLRHYNVSILHSIGIPDKYIMERGGWKSNYTMNNVYNHALKKQKNKFGEKISEHFENVYL